MRILFSLACLLFLVSGYAYAEQPTDSVGVKKEGGQFYILHKTEKGQGVYSIAKRYNVSMDLIRKANPELKNGLNIGQIVKVPIDEPKTAKKEETKPAEPYVVHVVKAGETLYAIAQKFEVSVADIKKKNKLSSNELQVGQELVIKGEKPKHTENYGGEENSTKTGDEDEIEPTAVKPVSYEYNKATGEVKESGYAVVAINENMNQKRSFALHPTAPTGTIIMVTNTSNNKSVFVRVVGRSNSDDQEVVILLSESSAKRLKIAENDRVMVNLNYAK